MAGGNKKKKKPAANPARGFATTSVPSKSRADPAEGADGSAEAPKSAPPSKGGAAAPPSSSQTDNTKTASSAAAAPTKELSAEEFEKHLEESELQLLVDKYAQKTKRDALRQKQRLETDRRLLRGQSESINSRKWLPPDLVDHILDLIQAESRFTASATASENSASNKLLPEEELTIKLWTLQQTLSGAGFPEDKLQPALQHVLDVSTSISGSAKDSIWGLDEALDWLARECLVDDLPDYDKRVRAGDKGWLLLHV